MSKRDDIYNQMQADDIEYLLVQFVDSHGSPKVKMVPANHLDDVIDEGAGFAGAAVWGLGQGPHSHDMLARVDLDSYSLAPWTQGVARFASDLYVDGEPYMYCPRQNFKRVLTELKNEGYTFHVGIEPEHFLVTLAGVSLLLRQIENIEDSDLRRHLCQSAIEICEELLEDPKI